MKAVRCRRQTSTSKPRAARPRTATQPMYTETQTRTQRVPVSEHRTTERRVKERRKRTSHGGSRQDSTPARDGGEYAQRLAPMRSPLDGTSHSLPRSHLLMRSVPRPHALPGWQRLTTHSSVVDGGPRAPPQSTARTHTLPGRQKAPTRSPPRPATPSTARYVRTHPNMRYVPTSSKTGSTQVPWRVL